MSAVAIKFRQAAILRSLCSGVKECGTNREQIFLFRSSPTTIFLTVSLPMFTSSASIHSERWRFWSNNWEIFSTLLSLRHSVGRPLLGSSSLSSRPSWNRPYYRKTFQRDSAWSPWAAFTICRVSVALFPALKQKFIANRCSILKSMKRLSHTASFHATNDKYCSTHSDSTKHTTCRDLFLRVSVGDRLMERVEFALHNQS